MNDSADFVDVVIIIINKRLDGFIVGKMERKFWLIDQKNSAEKSENLWKQLLSIEEEIAKVSY